MCDVLTSPIMLRLQGALGAVGPFFPAAAETLSALLPFQELGDQILLASATPKQGKRWKT